MPSHGKEDKVGPVRGSEPSQDVEQLEQLIAEEQHLQGESQKEGAKLDADTFTKMTTGLPRLIQRTLAKLEASQVFQNFKLPNRNAILSLFEKILLRRFEEKAEIAKPAPDGATPFLEKTAEQFRAFFARFRARTVKRTIPSDQVQELFVRGVIQKQNRTTVISDLALHDGRSEKFARFRLPAEAATLSPGSSLKQEALQRLLPSTLEYLAIKAGTGEPIFATTPQKGKFLKTARMEGTVASDLGLDLREGLKDKGGPPLLPIETRGQQNRKIVRWYIIALLVVVVGILLLFAR